MFLTVTAFRLSNKKSFSIFVFCFDGVFSVPASMWLLLLRLFTTEITFPGCSFSIKNIIHSDHRFNTNMNSFMGSIQSVFYSCCFYKQYS